MKASRYASRTRSTSCSNTISLPATAIRLSRKWNSGHEPTPTFSSLRVAAVGVNPSPKRGLLELVEDVDDVVADHENCRNANKQLAGLQHRLNLADLGLNRRLRDLFVFESITQKDLVFFVSGQPRLVHIDSGGDYEQQTPDCPHDRNDGHFAPPKVFRSQIPASPCIKRGLVSRGAVRLFIIAPNG